MNNSSENLFANANLFSDQMIDIKEMRKQHDEKIKRNDKRAFHSYIEFEKRNLRKMQQQCKDSKLIKQLSNKIIALHKKALSIFKEDLSFWISFIKFAIEIDDTELVSHTIKILLDVHKTEPNVWQLAAKWELNKFGNIDTAIYYLNKGIQYNPKATSLYTHVAKLLSTKFYPKNCTKLEAVDQQKFKTLSTEIFHKAIKAELNLDFFTELLKIYSESQHTQKIQFLICEHLMSKFKENDEMWHLLAQRELEGHHLTEDTYKYTKDNTERLKNCLTLYDKSIEVLPNEAMWEKYLNVLVDLCQTQNPNDLVKEKFMSVCNEAHNKNFLKEKHYVLWLKYIDNSERVLNILKYTNQLNPNYLQLWDMRIMHHLDKNEDDMVEKVFGEAVKTLGDQSVQIWQRKIQFYQLKGSEINKIESIYHEGIKFSPVVSMALQPQFLEWTALMRTGKNAHNLYNDLAKREPFCLELHKKMAELEAMSSNPSEEIFNSISNNLKNHSKEWEEYIIQEINYGPSWRGEIYKKYLAKEEQT